MNLVYETDVVGLPRGDLDFDAAIGILCRQREGWALRGAQSVVAIGFDGDRGVPRHTLSVVFARTSQPSSGVGSDGSRTTEKK